MSGAARDKVTERTGHMGNTFRLWAGGVDAVEGVFGHAFARASASVGFRL